MEIVIGKAAGRDFAIDAQELVTGRTCIIAQSGAGKSWSIAVLCEQLCRYRIGFCLIDTEGEYFSLKDKFDLIWIGADEECDYDIEKANLKEILRESMHSGIPVIYDVSEVAMTDKVARLAHILYDIATDERQPYLLIVEEADKFIPQSKDSIKKIEEISRRGRKRGLGMLVATQRPAIVTKNVLSQCNNQIIGKLSIENDLKAVDLFFGSKREVEELSTLNPGDFFVMGGLTREKTKMRFAKRETKHRGLTPLLSPREPSPLSPEPEDTEPAEMSHPPMGESENIPDVAAETAGKSTSREPASLIAEPEESSKTAKAPKTPRAKVRKRRNPSPLALKGMPVHITRDEALNIAGGKLKKKVLIFGEDERLASVELLYWPLYHVNVRYISGRIKKNTQETAFFIDGIHGHCAEPDGGLRLRPCFSDYIGLSEEAIRVLAAFSMTGETPTEIEAAARIGPAAVERAIDELLARKLVTAAEYAGGVPVYVPLVSHGIPKLGTSVRTLPSPPVVLDEVTVEECPVRTDDIRTILKVIEPTSEIRSCDRFYYPVYEVSIASGASVRSVFIDGLHGTRVMIQKN
ncbi:hypothetical protein AZH53_01570 [Methanomicrobiaceae archaeon CYW5]|uniref:ATP-binding protein n=1 Tax=Methanovulcanius yangii TaxID=1789227 RepID=UPI0029C9DAC8|nr:DUF87 domain-containing protein [Methanovulcanius yangii]MBT8507119.1 hypothetical protein [Methanovulcanius yangii]